MIDEQEESEDINKNELGEEAMGDVPDDFEILENEDGSATLIPESGDDVDIDGVSDDFYQNLVEFLQDKEPMFLNTLSVDYVKFIEEDKKAREKRDKQYEDALKRSGLGGDAPGGADFEGASKVVNPMIAEAAIDFSARAIKELFPPDGPVKTRIFGKVTPEKMRKAERKKRHMNWQTIKQIPEFRPALEQILTQVPMAGVQYSKMYYWQRSRRPKFEFVPMDEIYLPFHAANFYSAGRKTHKQRLTQREFEERITSGLYIDVDLGMKDPMTDDFKSHAEKANEKIEGKEEVDLYDEEGMRTVFEIYCHLEVPHDKYAETEYKYAPYIMTIDNPTNKVLAIYRNWDAELDTYEELNWIVEWQFIPWRGAYAIGLDNLIGGLSAAGTGALRALLDSAHVNNTPTAIKLKGAQVSGQSVSIGVTQISELDAAPGVDDIRKIAMPLPFNPPSSVLFQLLGFLNDTAKGVVRTALDDQPTSANTPVGTELSRVEQGLVVYSAIHARLHNSMERCLEILHRLNKSYLEPKPQQVDPHLLEEHSDDMDDELSIPLAFKDDYLGEMDVQPISDPNIFSDNQRFGQLQSIDALITKYPQAGWNIRAFANRMMQLMKVPNAEELLPAPPKLEDENPATENIKMAMGQPAGVMPDQDHLAHLQTHLNFAEDPVYGQNPIIQARMAAPFVEHIIQHMLMQYGAEVKQFIEQASGEKIKKLMGDDPMIKEALSKAVAAASPLALQQTNGLFSKILPMLQQFSQVAQANQPPQPMDPTVAAAKQAEASMAAVEAKKASDATNAQLKGQKDQSDAATKQRQQQLDAAKDQADNETKQAIASLDAQVELTKNREDNDTALQISSMRAVEGSKVGGNLKNGNSIDQEFADGGLVGDNTSNQTDQPDLSNITANILNGGLPNV